MSRELLKEAAQALETVQHYFPAQDEADKGLSVADVDACQRLMTKIEAYLAEPEPDAKWESIISKIRATDSKGEYRLDYWSAQKLIEEFAEQHAQAAALIEDYGRRVPRAMLIELWATGAFCSGMESETERKATINAIAAKHGVQVEDAK